MRGRRRVTSPIGHALLATRYVQRYGMRCQAPSCRTPPPQSAKEFASPPGSRSAAPAKYRSPIAPDRGMKAAFRRLWPEALVLTPTNAAIQCVDVAAEKPHVLLVGTSRSSDNQQRNIAISAKRHAASPMSVLSRERPSFDTQSSRTRSPRHSLRQIFRAPHNDELWVLDVACFQPFPQM